jgi:hypothetical protein
VVLHADDRSGLSGCGDLRGRGVAKPEMTHKPFCWSSDKTVSGASIDPSAGSWMLNVLPGLTIPSTSSPGLRRLS